MGIGGLGHLGIKWGKAFGCHVLALSHTGSKKEVALKLGADDFISLEDRDALRKARRTLDFILVTGNGKDMHWNAPLSLLKIDGIICLVGVPEGEISIPPWLLLNRICFTGSMVGGADLTKRMLNFASEHKIVADVQSYPMEKVNQAIKDFKDGLPRFRFVLVNKPRPKL